MAKLELTVGAELDGRRVDQCVAGLEGVGSRSAAVRLIEAGRVRLGEQIAGKSDRVAAGDHITVDLPEFETGNERASGPDFAVIHEDDRLLVVDKPAGLVVHPAPGHASGTLSQALAGRVAGGDPGRPGIVHRLDKDTSGLLVVAKDDQTLRALQSAIQAREIGRVYTALVRGRTQSASGTIDAPLGRDRRAPENIAVRRDVGREAVTHFESVEDLGPRTLLKVSLETGRTHQIRVHLAAIGLPVCGDPSYGVADDLGLTRQFLHAGELTFTHPASGDRMRFVSDLPGDLAAALELARRER